MRPGGRRKMKRRNKRHPPCLKMLRHRKTKKKKRKIWMPLSRSLAKMLRNPIKKPCKSKKKGNRP